MGNTAHTREVESSSLSPANFYYILKEKQLCYAQTGYLIEYSRYNVLETFGWRSFIKYLELTAVSAVF